jgi:hypothetical protein
MDYIRKQSVPKDGKLLAIGHSMGGILLYAMVSKCGMFYHHVSFDPFTLFSMWQCWRVFYSMQRYVMIQVSLLTGNLLSVMLIFRTSSIDCSFYFFHLALRYGTFEKTVISVAFGHCVTHINIK